MSIEILPISQLELDRQNPRLLDSDIAATDEAIIGNLYRTAELDELLQSVSANGYLNIEPLIVTHADTDAWTVLEGNRRLATLRLLTDSELVTRLRVQENIRIPVPPITPSATAKLRHVSVYKVKNRDAARAFIGFKHINGPAKWTAYAKAKFAADWYRNIKEGHGPGTLRSIARSIGDRHDTIKRMVSAIYVLEQAEVHGGFILKDRYTKKFNFSHLYTALSRSQYMQFLGIDGSWSRYDPVPNPVSGNKLPRLRELLVWIYGWRPDGIRPVVRVQNPDIKRLGEVLVNTEAIHVLRYSRNLERAHAATESADERFTTSLLRSRDNLREVANSLRGYNGSDKALLDVAEDIRETAASNYSYMARKFNERNL